jgi:hypothetical protein
MAVSYEKDLDGGDTEVDTALEPAHEKDEGRAEAYTDVALAEAAVERSRERVERSVTALRDELARRTDWRGWVAQRPAVFLGAAVLVGFLCGYRRGGGRGSNRR